jgi:uncharacterized glyoxalase superfamily protein PhnB
MRYRDLAASINWLCIAFGFERQLVQTGEDGSIQHAQLTFGDNMIMLWPVRDSEIDKLMKQPDEIGGAETQSCYFAVADADAHYSRAKTAGAEILMDLGDDDHGGRGYSCRDPEGHIWNFGTYNPWEGKVLAAAISAAMEEPSRSGLSTPIIVCAAIAALLASAAAGWMLRTALRSSPEETKLRLEMMDAQHRAEGTADRAAKQSKNLVTEQTARKAAEATAQELRDQLSREMTSKEITLKNTRRLEEQLAAERRAKEAAEWTSKGAAEEIAKERVAADAARRATVDVKRQLERERESKQRVEAAAQEAQDELSRERAAREEAERTAKEALARLAAELSVKRTAIQPAPATREPQPRPAHDSNGKRPVDKSQEPAARPMPPLLP